MRSKPYTKETTDAFNSWKLTVGDYLPYCRCHHLTAYGNGLWSAVALDDPVMTKSIPALSFMPAGTVDMGGTQVRFISVHTTSPTGD